MRVGDLVMNKTRYLGQVFMVVDMNKRDTLPRGQSPAIRCVRVSDGYKTYWNTASTWRIIA